MKKTFYVLQRGKLGNWSLSKDLKSADYFLRLTGLKRSVSIIGSDIIFSVWYEALLNKYYYFASLLAKKICGSKIISAVSHDIYSDKKIKKLLDLVDIWIVPNQSIYKHFTEKLKTKKVIKIPFFVSPKVFFQINKTREEIAKKFNLKYELLEGKLLLGSFQRDSLGKNLLKPKWQKNPELLIKICKQLPKEKYVLLLAGPRRHYLVKRCREEKIPFVFIGDQEYIDKGSDDLSENNLPEEKVNLLYNLIDAYIVTSQKEGGPKAVLECSLNKTLIFSTDVGLAREYLHPELIYEETDLVRVTNFINNLDNENDKIKSFLEYNYNKAITSLSEQNYLKFFREIISKI